MTESTKIDYVSIVQDLRDEADLCRNETATDIADLLDDAASCIVAMKSQFTALRSDLAAAREEAFTLAAGQCIVANGGLMGDDHGHLFCDMQRQRDELRGRVRVMADIMNTALDVIKTVEGDGSDEDEALMHIRAKMASAIDSVRRDDKSAIDAAIAGEKK